MIQNLKITGHQMQVTAAVRNFVIQKLNRMKKLLAYATGVTVHFAGEKKNGRVISLQIRVSLKKKVIVVEQFVSRKMASLYASINKAHEILWQQLSEHVVRVNKPQRFDIRRLAVHLS